jgi:hypothetical protein
MQWHIYIVLEYFLYVLTSHNFDHRVLFIVFSHILPNSIKNIIRERPFNLKGVGYGFILKKIF